MITLRHWIGTLAISAGLTGVACSHEQKAPPALPSSAPLASHAPVRSPAPPPKATSADSSKDKEEPSIFFDFDSYSLRDDAHPILQKLAASLRSQRSENLNVQGNCDELGTTEYNMALGEERARAAKTYLEHLGVPGGRVTMVSYGSQRPKFPGHDDDAHAKNRRDDLVVR